MQTEIKKNPIMLTEGPRMLNFLNKWVIVFFFFWQRLLIYCITAKSPERAYGEMGLEREDHMSREQEGKRPTIKNS